MNQPNLSLFFVSGNKVEPSMKEKYRQIYGHWESVWETTFREITPNAPFFSDQFTRQDEVMGLFHENRCISVCCHRWIDLSLPSFRKDSYFEVWSDRDLEVLKSRGSHVVIDNQISVDPDYRKTMWDFKVIELMSYISFRHLSRLPTAAITAAARNTRSMDSLFEKFNPEILQRSVLYHGEETSLYALFPQTMKFEKMTPEIRELGDGLLRNSVRSQLIPRFETQKEEVSHVPKIAG